MDLLGLIILNYNSADDTIYCVSNLLEFQESYKIIIVDNCSTDNSYEVLQSRFRNINNVDLIKTDSNKGYSAGNNFGIKYAINKYGVTYVGILNPDVIISNKMLLEDMLSILDRHKSAAIIGGATQNPEGVYNENIAAWNIPTGIDLVLDHSLFFPKKRTLKVIPVEKDVVQVGCVMGCLFLAKISMFEEMGFLDENIFLYNEENVLGIKCKKYGYQVLLYEKGYYIHNHKYTKNPRIPFKKKVMATHNTYKSRRYLCKKYYPKYILPLLDCAEFFNKVYLIMAYMWSYVK